MSDTPDATDSTEPGGAAEVPAVELTPSGGAHRRRALWGVLAVLAIAGGALAVVAVDDDDPPRLPVALGAVPEGGRNATAAADMSMMAYVRYVAGDDLPDLGGSAPAYRLAGGATEAEVRALGTALGLSGDPVHEDGYWNLQSGDAQLQVYDDGGGSWWFNAHTFVDGGATGGGSSGSEGCAPDAKECAVTSDEALAREADVCKADPGCLPSTTTSTIPADLPSREEAEAIARDVLAATGMSVEDAEVTVDGPYDGWYVSVTPRVDGVLVSGLAGSVAVGPKGEILNAGGMLGSPERMGDYPTIDTREAIDRLNDGSAYGSGAGLAERSVAEDVATAEGTDDTVSGDLTSTTLAAPPADIDPDAPSTAVADEPIDGPIACATDGVATPEAGPVATTVPGTEPATDPATGDGSVASPPIDPCGPYPTEPTEPIEVVLHRAERILVMIGANDGSGDAYLVPGYRMTGDDSQVVDVPSVDDESLLPTTPVEPADGGGTTGGTDGAIVPGTIEPGATRCAQPEPGPDGAVPDICLDPNSVPPAQGGTTGSVDPG